MKILNQNLQEGQKAEEVKAQNVAKVTSKATIKSQTSKVQAKATVATAIVATKEDKKPRTTIKFSFTMNSFVIDLMNTISVSIIVFF